MFKDENGKRDFIDFLIEDLRRIKYLQNENLKDLITLDFDPTRFEARLAFKYDHHAFAVAESDITKLRIPREV